MWGFSVVVSVLSLISLLCIPVPSSYDLYKPSFGPWLLSVHVVDMCLRACPPARLSFHQVHLSPEGRTCCELSDGSAGLVQPLMQLKRRRNGDKWEVVSQSVFLSLCAVRPRCVTLPPSVSQRLCTCVCLGCSDATQECPSRHDYPL